MNNKNYHTFELKVDRYKRNANLIKNINDKHNENMQIFSHKTSEPLNDRIGEKSDKKNKSGNLQNRSESESHQINIRTNIRKSSRTDQQNILNNYKLANQKSDKVDQGFGIESKAILRPAKNILQNNSKKENDKVISKSYDFKIAASQTSSKNNQNSDKTDFIIKKRKDSSSPGREQKGILGVSIFDRKNSDQNQKLSRNKLEDESSTNSLNLNLNSNHVNYNKAVVKSSIVNSMEQSKKKLINNINHQNNINTSKLINELKKSNKFEKEKTENSQKMYNDYNMGKESETNDNKKRIMFNQSLDFSLNEQNKLKMQGKINMIVANHKNGHYEEKNQKKIPLKSNRNALLKNTNRDVIFFNPVNKNEKNNAKSKSHRLPMLNGYITQVPNGTTENENVQRKIDQAFEKHDTQPLVKKKLNISNPLKSDYAIVKQNLLNDPHGYYLSGVQMFFKSSDKNYFVNLYRDHFKHTFTSLQFCKNLKHPSKRDLVMKKVSLNRKDSDKHKKTLVLDLDETLIHCNTTGMGRTDVVLPIKFPSGETLEAAINIRPGCQDFLREMAKLFEVVVFTASHGCYANVVLDYLDPNREWVSHRLFREKCLLSDSGVYIKDQRVIDRNLNSMVLVDNASYSFGYQLDNGIPIVPFYNSRDDVELTVLKNYLKELNKEKDVRDINRRHFQFRKIIENVNVGEAWDMLFLNKK